MSSCQSHSGQQCDDNNGRPGLPAINFIVVDAAEMVSKGRSVFCLPLIESTCHSRAEQAVSMHQGPPPAAMEFSTALRFVSFYGHLSLYSSISIVVASLVLHQKKKKWDNQPFVRQLSGSVSLTTTAERVSWYFMRTAE